MHSVHVLVPPVTAASATNIGVLPVTLPRLIRAVAVIVSSSEPVHQSHRPFSESLSQMKLQLRIESIAPMGKALEVLAAATSVMPRPSVRKRGKTLAKQKTGLRRVAVANAKRMRGVVKTARINSASGAALVMTAVGGTVVAPTVGDVGTLGLPQSAITVAAPTKYTTAPA